MPATPSTTTWGTRLTAHATPHSKGVWATLLTTTLDAYGFWLSIAGTSTAATRTDMLIEVATGPSQENIIIQEMPCGWRATASVSPYVIWFPIFIPAGTLVSARIQSLITVDTADVLFYVNGGAISMPGPLFAGCDAYGIVTASSQGTSHTPGNTGAESTAANIGSTTSRAYGGVMLCVQGTMAIVVMTSIAYHWELVIGGTSVCEWRSGGNTSEYNIGPFPPAPFHTSIPESTQLQVRAEASGTAQAQDVSFLCFY